MRPPFPDGDAEHFAIYSEMKSLAYKMKLSRMRVDRIRVAVAEEQMGAARRLRRSTERKLQRLGLARLGFWADLANAAEDALGV